MKWKEFNILFPDFYRSQFNINGDGDVLYQNEDDVSEPAFWQNKEAVKSLNLSITDYHTYLLDPLNFLKTYKLTHKYTPKKLESFWKPEEWAFNPNSTPPAIKLTHPDIDLQSFRIYVNEKDFFVHKDSFLDFSSIDKIDFKDEKNDYCIALKAMYVLSYLGGISIKNLKSENSLASSLAHFYFYYHLKKFLNYRNFSSYNTEPLEELDWSLYHWRNHFVWYHSQISYTPSSLKRDKDEIIRNIKHVGKKVHWHSRLGKRDISKDYLSLIQSNSEGLTKTGQILFQESSQAYVYCILGAQAKTRWKIIGDGANSFQTQQVFSSLVEEITSQNNLSILIKSMRLAIASTNVRLDFVISPGLDVLPSDLVYIKDSPGYNNVLLISNSSMRFGKNNVNKVMKQPQTTEIAEKKPSENKKTDEPSNVPILLSTGLIALLSRLFWVGVI